MNLDRPLIEVSQLEAWYGRRRILHGVDFNVHAGEIRVIMGGSGSGKSTLLRHLLGLHRPRSGTIRLLGADIGHASEAEMLAVRKQIGVSFQGGAPCRRCRSSGSAQPPPARNTEKSPDTSNPSRPREKS